MSFLEANIQKCRDGKCKFTDEDFPPTTRSLIGVNAKLTEDPPSSFSSLKWKRLGEFPKVSVGDPIFRGISPNDVRQGILGNCYFVAAVCGLAEYPSNIKRLFENEEVNEWGVYSLWFFVNGEWKNVIIDDYIPVNENEKMVFMTSKTNQLWVPLLEKAYAKAYGGYFPTIFPTK